MTEFSSRVIRLGVIPVFCLKSQGRIFVVRISYLETGKCLNPRKPQWYPYVKIVLKHRLFRRQPSFHTLRSGINAVFCRNLQNIDTFHLTYIGGTELAKNEYSDLFVSVLTLDDLFR